MADVRMRGFRSRVEVPEALETLDQAIPRLGVERISIENAHGRVLAGDLVAEIAMPSFDRAAMDGYAVIARDTFGASSFSPVSLRIVGESFPARPWEGELSRGQAVRIMTGSPVPTGADAVVMAEMTEAAGNAVEIRGATEPAKHIGRKGEDVRVGDRVLRAGRRLRPQDVALAGSLGSAELDVVQRPRVLILGTGNELVPVGTMPAPHHVVDSNSVMLAGLVERDGGVVVGRDIVPDDADRLETAMTGDAVDVVLVSGGSSVGLEDHAPRVLERLGEVLVHGVAMRPSSPTGFGKIGHRFVFLLPGNPVSCLCAYEFFAGRAIRALGGRSRDWPHRRRTLPLADKIASAVGRLDYVRVAVEPDGVRPIATSGASILSSTTRADGFVIVEGDSEGHAAGEQVEVWFYDE